MNTKLFSVTDSIGGYHAFDPARVNTITTYKVGSNIEFRCEVRVGREEDQQGSNEQLFLIRQNSMTEAVALGERIKQASDEAKRAQHLVGEFVYLSDGTGIDPTTIAYIKKSAEGFCLTVELKFTPENSSTYYHDFGSQEDLDIAYKLLTEARNRVSCMTSRNGGGGIVNYLQQIHNQHGDNNINVIRGDKEGFDLTSFVSRSQMNTPLQNPRS